MSSAPAWQFMALALMFVQALPIHSAPPKRAALGPVAYLDYSLDGKLLTAVDTRGNIRQWELPGVRRASYEIPSLDWPYAFAIARPNGSIAYGSRASVIVKDPARAIESSLRVSADPAAKVRSLAFSRDGKHLAVAWTKSVATKDPAQVPTFQVTIYDMVGATPNWQSGQEPGIGALIGFTAIGDCVAVKPFGEYGTVRLWNVKSGRETHRFDRTEVGGDIFSFSRNGKLLAASNTLWWDLCFRLDLSLGKLSGGAIDLWEIATGRKATSLRNDGAYVTCLAFAEDGRTLVASYGNSIVIWDWLQKREKGRLRWRDDEITAFALSLDGTKIALGTSSGRIRYLALSTISMQQPDSRMRLDLNRRMDLWKKMADPDASVGYEALRHLVNDSDVAVFLEHQILGTSINRENIIKKDLNALDDDRFVVRERAQRELELLGESASSALVRRLRENPPAEARMRIEQIMRKKGGPGLSLSELRVVRALEAFEQIGDGRALQSVERIVQRSHNAFIVSEAKAVLERLRLHTRR